MANYRRPSAPEVTVNDVENDDEPQTIARPIHSRYSSRPLDTYPDVHGHELRGYKRGGGTDFKGQRRHNAYSAGVPWREKIDCNSWKGGRVLLVDYVGKEHTENGRRKIVAQEFWNLEGLKKFYAKTDRSKEAALRVIHVQNASWATRFLLHKFNINHHDDLVGTDFGKWAKYERPQRRAGKPVLNGKTFKTQRDPWRGINRTAFGVDYLKQYERGEEGGGNQRLDQDQAAVKMMELNCYDENDIPTYGYDVFVQRLSVYIQKNEGPPQDPDDPNILNPYMRTGTDYSDPRKGSQPNPMNGSFKDMKSFLQNLDNGNTVIVFEHSHTALPQDTLIPARGEIENRWRRLAFYLPREDAMDDDRLAAECMDLVLSDVFKSLAAAWDRYLYICGTHVGILEDKIYESPADESRAPELWTNSSLWLKVEKLITIHTATVKEMQLQLEDLDDSVLEHGEWIRSMPAEFDKIANNVQEDLVKPTQNLNDLMYKSVGIRDSRHSLQLGTSMWRLSWITFIFLPLTFIVGFFGMNVDTFTPNPSIKWYFIAAVPLMVLVLILWYVLKHFLARRRQTPYQRGIYEHLYHDLAIAHPSLWSRSGPRDSVRPKGLVSALKWRLLEAWFAPEKTIRLRPTDDDEDGSSDLGTWARIKRTLARRWLSTLRVQEMGELRVEEAMLESESDEGLGAMTELLEVATPVAVGQAEPRVAEQMREREGTGHRLSPTGVQGRVRSVSTGSRDSGGIMVEEKGTSDDDLEEEERDS
ncbi:hypothetical protein EV356DRAFT_469524 [Viridothelium virens]|uniref:Cora-domain-containing protein n=1 Tax=Viridothelium virens TaxID=1048519 RepID=A0A6A6H4B3_VIRVR|nr:hypothetical protein EV356DRAFT_469524 [Viridothelium virens]